MKAKEIMERYQIHRTTLCRWVKEGRITVSILPSGRYDYLDKISTPKNNRKNIIYARVSSTTQKDNLPRQIERLKSFASANGFVIDEIYSEIASALNYERRKYRQLFKEIVENKIDTIFIEYKDRMLRIGFQDFENLCKLYNTKIIVVDNTINNDKSKHEEITTDLISIIHHFSVKIYSARRTKKIVDTITEIEPLVL
jgi:predicted site-specific integrase-resolvase